MLSDRLIGTAYEPRKLTRITEAPSDAISALKFSFSAVMKPLISIRWWRTLGCRVAILIHEASSFAWVMVIWSLLWLRFASASMAIRVLSWPEFSGAMRAKASPEGLFRPGVPV